MTQLKADISQIRIFWTPRFANRYYKYAGISNSVEKRTAELLKMASSGATDWHRELERLKDDSFRGLKVVKIPISRSDRLIFVLDLERLIFTDIGNHDVMQEYAALSPSTRNKDIGKALPAPRGFLADVYKWYEEKSEMTMREDSNLNLADLFVSNQAMGDLRWRYDEELDEKWIHFLDETQIQIKDTIYQAIENQNTTFSIHYLLGGPGTGKTVILLSLANQFKDAELAISFEASIPVKKYLESSGSLIPGFGLGPGPGVIQFIDDPGTAAELDMRIRHAKSSGNKSVIVAIDPLQWSSDGEIDKFQTTFNKYAATIHTLWVCYRQSKNVAKSSLPIMERVVLRSITQLKNTHWTKTKEMIQPYIDLSLGMEFVDEQGFFQILDSVSNERLALECNRFLKRYDLWKHTHPFCLVYSQNASLASLKYFRQLTTGFNRKDIKFENINDLRGLEFQEIFMFFNKSEWNKLVANEYYKDSATWENAISLHIAFSRAKDGVTVCLTDQ